MKNEKQLSLGCPRLASVIRLWITKALVCCVASKELEEPEQTAERVGISALIVQVHTHTVPLNTSFHCSMV